jgi:hypothetical protein
MQPICAEYGLQKFLAPFQKSCIRSRTTTHLCWISARNMTRVVIKFDYWSLECSLSVLNKGSKHDSRQVKKFAYWCWTCRLSEYVLQTWLALTKYSCSRARPTVYLCWIWAVIMTCAKWRNSFIGSRHANYLCWIWTPNLTFANRINMYIGERPTAYLFLIWVRNTFRVMWWS